jgi:hypothetical protein
VHVGKGGDRSCHLSALNVVLVGGSGASDESARILLGSDVQHQIGCEPVGCVLGASEKWYVERIKHCVPHLVGNDGPQGIHETERRVSSIERRREIGRRRSVPSPEKPDTFKRVRVVLSHYRRVPPHGNMTRPTSMM